MGKKNRSKKRGNGGKSLQQQTTAHNVTPFSAITTQRRSARLSAGSGDGNNNDDVGSAQLKSPEQTVTLKSPPEQTPSILCDAELKRNGVHPVSKLKVRTCICSTPDPCRAMMWEYATIGKKDMFPYLKLPVQPQDDTTPTRKHAIAYRKNVYHHLYGKDITDIVEDMASTGDERIALLHFDPRIRKCLHDLGKIDKLKKQYKWRVPLDVGKHNVD